MFKVMETEIMAVSQQMTNEKISKIFTDIHKSQYNRICILKCFILVLKIVTELISTEVFKQHCHFDFSNLLALIIFFLR